MIVLLISLLVIYSLCLSEKYSLVFTKFTSQIDRSITELVTEQQKIDAKRAHDKSELEQLKQDIANANKQKNLISKACGNKVFLAF